MFQVNSGSPPQPEELESSLPAHLSPQRPALAARAGGGATALAPRQAGSRQVCPVVSFLSSSGLSVSGFIPRSGLLHLQLILLARRILGWLNRYFLSQHIAVRGYVRLPL